MSRFAHFKLLALVFLVVMLAHPIHAAKVVRLFNAWPQNTKAISVAGWWNGNFNGPGGGNSFMTLKGNWHEFVLPANYDATKTVNTSGIFFSLSGDWNTTYDNAGSGSGQALIDIAAVLKNQDTVWIAPSVSPGGAPKVLSVIPKPTVVMFLNPWEADSAPPYVASEGGKAQRMTMSGVHPGWAQATLFGYNKLSLVFQSKDGKKFYGSAGTSINLPLPVILDSLIGKDTVWVRPSPEPTGKPVASSLKPKGLIIMLLNPWGKTPPIRTPRIHVDGSPALRMATVDEFCGWYAFSIYERSPKVFFSVGTTAAALYGAKGFKDSTKIDLTTQVGDTIWIKATADTGLPAMSRTFPGDKGLCSNVLLAATVRDFPSGRNFQDGSRNWEFGYGLGCDSRIQYVYARDPISGAILKNAAGKDSVVTKGGSWYPIVPGMVSSTLGMDGKPVRSPVDTGRFLNGTWVDRCVYTTGPGEGQKAVGDSGLSAYWFRTVPGKNTETCRDIPLTLDTLTATYKYDNQKYFPIDDFKTLPDGTPNFNYDENRENWDWPADPNPVRHNYGFCIESKGTFDYQKGQVYDFRGDDDVWFFVNNQLIVDLGGVHGATSTSVLLDTIGTTRTRVLDKNGQVVRNSKGNDSILVTPGPNSLVPGKSYSFNFFFCERNPTGSSMRINTSMNLRTDAGFLVRDTIKPGGNASFTLYVSLTSGTGCQAQTQVTRTTGIVRLLGGAFTSPKQLSTGTWYGGIGVDSAAGRVTIDSTNLAGLAPGRYIVQFVSILDTTIVRNYSFVVPYTAGPRFMATPAYSGLVGTVLPVVVGAYNAKGRDSSALRFYIKHAPGVTVFADSLRTRVISESDTMKTGINGIGRRFWVRGDSAGSYVLILSSTTEDTADTYSNIVFQGKGLRFTDATGASLGTVTPILRNVGDTVRVWLGAFAGNDLCTSCTDSVRFSSPDAGLVFLDSAQAKPLSGIRLKGGRTSVRVTAVAPVRNGSFVATSDTSGTTATWSPVSFLPWRLQFVNDAGVVLDSSALQLDTTILSAVKWRLQAAGVDSVCTTCTQKVAMFSSVGGVELLDTNGLRVDSIALNKGRIRFQVQGTKEVQKATVLFTAGPAYDTARLAPVTFRVKGPDSASWYDDNGDGRADRAVVYLHHPWTDSTRVLLAWPDTTNLRVVKAPQATLSSDKKVLTWVPDTALQGTAMVGTSPLGRFSRDSGTVQEFIVRDRIAPVISRAVIRWGSERDTLRVRPSESLAKVSDLEDLVHLVRGNAPGQRSLFEKAWLDTTTGELLLTYLPNSSTAPIPGDSVRFAPNGGVQDRLNNRVGTASLRVPVLGTDRPPRDAELFDSNNDGRADKLVLHMTSPFLTTKELELYWPNLEGVLDRRLIKVDSAIVDSNGLRYTFQLSSPFAYGSTSCPIVGCASLGQLRLVQDSDTLRTGFAVQDRVPPMLIQAQLAYAADESDSDTLKLTFSEPIKTASDSRMWVNWKRNGSSSIQGEAVPASAVTLAPDGRSGWVFTKVDSLFAPVKGDSVRISASGVLQDMSGNTPSDTAVWTPFELGTFPAKVSWQPFASSIRNRPEGTSNKEPIQILVRTNTGSWTTLDGTVLDAQDTAGLGGVLMRVNLALDGNVFVYDNLGVHSVSLNLATLAKAWKDGLLDTRRDYRGNVQVWIAWDGRSSKGNPVASGVYVLRLVGSSVEKATPLRVNQLIRLGWK